MRPFHQRFCIVAVVLILSTFATARADQPAAPRVNVILWFDTEDYLSPSDDDSAKRLAELLTARKIRATFKIVGEKARVLELRHRADVIDALNRHDIGFHGNFHSVHPTVSEYEANAGLLDGISEFVRREGAGAADVRRIFGRNSLACYGQPGSSWAAQAIAALPLCGVTNDGIPCYLDSGDHVGFGGIPFWYAGALVVYKMRPNETRMDLFAPNGLEQGEQALAAIAQRLRSTGGGLISIYYHPCEWVTSEFWDGANFSHGANPPREEWKLPKQRRADETENAFHRFEQYIDFIRAQPNVQFVTASQLPALYPDRVRTEPVSSSEVAALVQAMRPTDGLTLDDRTIEGKIFSPADQFDLLTLATARAMEAKADSPADAIPIDSLLGPDSPPPTIPPATDAARVAWPAFAAAVLDVRDFLQTNHRIPSRVFIGATAVSPADFLVAMTEAQLAHLKTGRFPATVLLGRNVRLITEDRVAQDTDRLFGGWIIHAPGFRAPHIMEIARLQAWTLKPATASAK